MEHQDREVQYRCAKWLITNMLHSMFTDSDETRSDDEALPMLYGMAEQQTELHIHFDYRMNRYTKPILKEWYLTATS